MGRGKVARTSVSPGQIARKIRPSATIGTATNSLANVSKLGHLAAHSAFRQLAPNVVKSRLPGANQARNCAAVVLDEIQGTAALMDHGRRCHQGLRHRASPVRFGLRGLATAFIGNVTRFVVCFTGSGTRSSC
jgi:hypothetical protein